MLLLIASVFASPAGVLVGGTVENGPLASKCVQRFDVISAINNTQVNTLQGLADYLANVTPGSMLVLRINDNDVSVVTENLSRRAVIGLSNGFDYHPCRLGLDRVTTANLYLTLYWVFLAAFSVAVFNMLPAFPFDGEKFLYYSLESFMGKEKRLQLRVLINAVFLGLLLANMVLSFWYFGLPRV